MSRLAAALILSTSIAALATLAVAQDGAAPAGPPPMPLYRMRDAVPEGDRLDTEVAGDALYSNRCGACHLEGGMGTNLLTVQRMRLGEPPEKGLLVNRNDLLPEYIRTVVREGKVAMPRLTRVEVTDSELDAIVDFLAGDGR